MLTVDLFEGFGSCPVIAGLQMSKRSLIKDRGRVRLHEIIGIIAAGTSRNKSRRGQTHSPTQPIVFLHCQSCHQSNWDSLTKGSAGTLRHPPNRRLSTDKPIRVANQCGRDHFGAPASPNSNANYGARVTVSSARYGRENRNDRYETSGPNAATGMRSPISACPTAGSDPGRTYSQAS